MTAPTNVTAGIPFTVTVTAKDQFGNVSTGYSGTIRFTSNDTKAILPVNYAFQASDGGIHNFSVTLKTTGTLSLTATDTFTGITGADSSIVVSGVATHFAITGAPTSTVAGNTFSYTVTALDSSNNVAIGYAGTLRFSSNDPNATLPASTTLSSGIGNFSATLTTAGCLQDDHRDRHRDHDDQGDDSRN